MHDASTSESGSADRLLTPHFLLVTAAALSVFVGFGATIPLLPRFIEQEFGDGDTAIGIVFGSIAVTAIIVRPYAARLSDTLGRRFLILAGSGITAAGIALHAVATSSEMLVPFRLIMGAGQGMFFVGAATLINDLASPERRGEAASYFSVAVYGGLGIGPVVGEQLLDAVGFTSAWLISAGFVVGGAIIAAPLPRRIGIPEAPPAPAADESRLRRLAHPAGLLPGFVLMLGIMPYAAFASYAPGHAEDVGLDDAGTVFTVYAATVLVVRLFGAKVPDRLGLRTTSTAALVTIAAGMLLMATLQTPWGLHLAAAVYALGQSLLYPALFAAAVNSVGDDERSRVVATFTMFFDISTGLGGLILGIVAGFGGPVGAFFAGSAMAAFGLVALQSLLADRADQSSDGSTRQTSSSPTARST